MFPDFEFHHLKGFVAVARTGNFTRAAEELGLSQSALSRSVRKLELQVGKPLFERQPRKITLTPLGEIFYPRAIEILQLVEQTFHELSEANHGGHVRLAVIPTIAPYFLPRLLSDFAQQVPNIKISVLEETSEISIKKCEHGEVDIAILALPLEISTLESIELFSEELFLVLPANHPLGEKTEISVSELSEIPFVMLGDDHCLSDQVESFCQRQELQPISIERTSQLTTVQELVSLEHGISIVPNMARSMDQSSKRIYRSFVEPTPTRTIAAVTNPNRKRSQALDRFLEFLQGFQE